MSAGPGVMALLPLALLACVTQEHRAVEEAQAAHARCVAEHSASHPDCEALEERERAAERRYQENSRRAWGCDPAQDECPTPR